MSNNILIIPGSASIQFSGSANNDTMRLQVEPSGSVAFYGNSGSLFTITDNLSGSLMSVNDISGLPVLEVFSDDRVVMGSFNKNTLVVTGSRVGIGSTTPNANLDVSGSVVITGSLFVSGSTPLEVGDNANKLKFGSTPTNDLLLTGSNWQMLRLATSNPSNAAIVVFDATGSASPVLPKWLVGQRHGNHGRLSFWRFTTTGGGAGHQPNTLTLTSQSLVGINTNDPQATLHVVGNVSASSFTGSFAGTATSASYAVSASVLIGGTSTTDQAVSPFLLMGAS